MKLKKSPAKEGGIIGMKDANLTPLPRVAPQGLNAPTVFYAFILILVV